MGESFHPPLPDPPTRQVDSTLLFSGFDSPLRGDPDLASTTGYSSLPDVDPTASSIWSVEQISPRFNTAYEIVTSVRFASGISASPLAKPKGEGKTAFWRNSGGHAMLFVTWMAERLGTCPVLPFWELLSPLYVFCEGEITPEAPTPLPNGLDMGWRVRGWYSYYLQVPPSQAYYFPVAATRVHTIPASVMAINGNQFSREMLNFLDTIQVPPVTI